MGYIIHWFAVTVPSSTPPQSDAERIRQLERQLRWAELKIQVLEERLRLQLIAKYGPASEKLSDTQLQLLEPGVSQMEVQAESEPDLPLTVLVDESLRRLQRHVHREVRLVKKKRLRCIFANDPRPFYR